MNRQAMRMLSRFLDTAVEQAGEVAYLSKECPAVMQKVREAEQHVRLAKRILAECLETEMGGASIK